MAQDRRQHTHEAKAMMEDLVRRLREDVGRIDDPQGKALFETGAEVVQGLRTAFVHYEERSEEAWREELSAREP